MNTNADLMMMSVIKALSDPIRLKIMYVLKKGRDGECLSPTSLLNPQALCPKDILRKMEDLSDSKLSYHLKEMKQAGLVVEHREGKRIFYELNTEPLGQLSAWLDGFSQ
ncbi:ArsR/SmtB family transcription factor [Brevibacillus sp. NRS-1366]|uniref:ArsR/SmtB family transcription factor n=1 Tax=Brevibacillus sp. NRS-1366 TaxID=3233899 RepID=UPI003D1BFC1C